jgi:mannose-6-phosphate isomerase-like protein (cupin superfamily)
MQAIPFNRSTGRVIEKCFPTWLSVTVIRLPAISRVALKASGSTSRKKAWTMRSPAAVVEREQPAEAKPQTARDYETVGLVLEGKAELHIEGQLVLLEKGDSWVVPKGSRHTYKVIETFTPVEATSPPAEVHGRDE